MSEAVKSKSDQANVPRWARDAAAEMGQDAAALWERINDLLMDGFDTPDIMDALSLPSSKRRSLQVYAAKFGPRRRLLQFAKFKDALLRGAVDAGDDLAKGLALAAKYAVSEKVKPEKQQAAMGLMVKFTQALSKLMSAEEADQRTREKEAEKTGGTLSAEEIVQQIHDLYGIRRS